MDWLSYHVYIGKIKVAEFNSFDKALKHCKNYMESVKWSIYTVESERIVWND